MNKLTSLATLAGAMVLGPAAVGGIPAASAATISYDGAGALNYQAAPGEVNHPSFQEDSGVMLVSDAMASQLDDASGQCQPGYVSYVLECPMPAAVTAELGDRDDRVTLDTRLRVTVAGGDGKDLFRNALGENPVEFHGGAGNDEITGGEAADTLDGGPGDDTVTGRGANDVVNGGDGDDLVSGDGHNVENGSDVIDGGPGFDRIEGEWSDTEASTQPRLNVTLGGGNDDGRPGEGDDVRGVESLFLYAAGDYTGTDGPEKFQVHQITGPSTMRGAGGDDDIDASDGNDTLDGGTGKDVLDGGFGDDHIVGGPGQDQLHGDTPEGECSYIYCKNPFGNDTIQARDGEMDSIDCGVGHDRVVADKADAVAGDCEVVERDGGEIIPDDPRDDDPAGVCVVPKLKGLAQRAAERKLVAAGCKVKVKRARSRTVARGRVVKASSKAGSRVAKGTRVTITVSRGR
jgi:Ca2+-binding RTX toxin-like protein